MTGIDPAAIGTEVRLARSGRENAATRALRFLVEARVQVRRADERGVVADVRGDSGAIHRVAFDPFADAWSCDCDARGQRCSHIRAVAAVVVVVVQR